MNYSRLKELIDYITVVGPPDDKKRSYKFKYFQIFRFPLSASDVLSSEISSII
jgi:hypothetical protein